MPPSHATDVASSAWPNSAIYSTQWNGRSALAKPASTTNE